MAVRLDNRVAVVTGAGRGIGRATARQLAAMGAAVVVNDLGTAKDGAGADASLADQVAAEIRDEGGRAIASPESVTDFEAAGRIIGAGLSEWGRVDILVNNAGLSGAGVYVDKLDPDDFARVMHSHVLGTFNCTRHALGDMLERGWGRIVNLVSRGGLVGTPGAIAYGAGKGGVFGFTNVASRELGKRGINVNAVNPASTETRMVTDAIKNFQDEDGPRSQIAKGLIAQMQKPENVAAVIAYLCSEEAAHINGHIFFVEKNSVAPFVPLTTGTPIEKEGGFSVDELADAAGKLQLPELDIPYASG